jgi:hypothetical protein
MTLRDFDTVAIPRIIRIYSRKYSAEEDKYKETELFCGIQKNIPMQLKDRYVLRVTTGECMLNIEVTRDIQEQDGTPAESCG